MRPSNSLVWSKRLHWENYFRPQTVSEALGLLEKFKGSARIIAGGTDLLLRIREREMEPKALVDITRIPGLEGISLQGGWVKIGGLATHTQVVESPLIQEKALCLKEGASRLGSPQIRNIGTLAGNLVSGQPGADSAIPLLALDGEVRVANQAGERTIPLAEFFIDTGRTAVDSSREIIMEILFRGVKDGREECLPSPGQEKGAGSAYFDAFDRAFCRFIKEDFPVCEDCPGTCWTGPFPGQWGGETAARRNHKREDH